MQSNQRVDNALEPVRWATKNITIAGVIPNIADHQIHDHILSRGGETADRVEMAC